MYKKTAAEQGATQDGPGSEDGPESQDGASEEGKPDEKIVEAEFKEN